jgi:hypothetical protein
MAPRAGAPSTSLRASENESFRLQYGGDLVERLSGGLSLGIERIVGQWFLLVSDANRDGSFCENYLSMSVEP